MNYKTVNDRGEAEEVSRLVVESPSALLMRMKLSYRPWIMIKRFIERSEKARGRMRQDQKTGLRFAIIVQKKEDKNLNLYLPVMDMELEKKW